MKIMLKPYLDKLLHKYLRIILKLCLDKLLCKYLRRKCEGKNELNFSLDLKSTYHFNFCRSQMEELLLRLVNI